MCCGPEKDHVNLQTPSSSLEQPQTRPPGTSETTLPLAGADATCEPIPSPSLTIDPEGNDKFLSGLYAAGDVGCNSVHSANRPGANSFDLHQKLLLKT